MRFLVDAQLPPALCRWLKARDCDAVHVYHMEEGLTAPDALIWERAKAEDRVIVSKDADFFDRAILFGQPPQVLHVNVGNCSNRMLLALLDEHWTDIETVLSAGAPLVRLSQAKLDIFGLPETQSPFSA